MISRQELFLRLSNTTISEDSSLETHSMNDLGAKPASVLIPLLNISGSDILPDWHLLFTRRTDRVADHKRQVSFPGGRADPHDPGPEGTALREASEEIGLKPEDVQIIGKLEQILTITNYLVTPVVGLIPWPYPFILQPEEVSRVFSIPLDWLADPANHEIRHRDKNPDGSAVPLREVIYFKAYDGEILWGVSAEITIRFVRKLYEQYDQ